MSLFKKGILWIALWSAVTGLEARDRDIAISVDSLKQVIKQSPTNVEALHQLGLYALNLRNDSLATDCGKRLIALSRTDKKGGAAIYGNLILGQSKIMVDESPQGYRYLTEARRLAEAQRDSLSLASIFNGLAIYDYSYVGDLAGALTYYYKGLSCAKAAGNNRLYYQLLRNIANAHTERGDTLGLVYARECYSYAISSKDHWLKYSSAICLSDIYRVMNDYSRALRYIAEAEEELPHLKGVNASELYRMKAQIQTSIGAEKEADVNYRRAKAACGGNTMLYLPILNQQAEYEIERSHLSLARTLLDSALNLTSQATNTHARLRTLQLHSKVSQQEGDLTEALKYQQAYSALKDSTYSLTTARMMCDAYSHFEFDELSNQLAQQKLNYVRQQRNTYVAISIILLLLAGATVIYYYHLRLKRIYKKIVEQMRVSIQSENALRARIQVLESNDHNRQPIKAQTLQSIIDDMDQLLEKEKIYTDPTLTRDGLAEIIGTNPTYLTRAISERYGIAFTQYINNFRIKEAIRILSDPTNDTPIKALGMQLGYNSPTSFYNHFKQATGMTPAAYRTASCN